MLKNWSLKIGKLPLTWDRVVKTIRTTFRTSALNSPLTKTLFPRWLKSDFHLSMRPTSPLSWRRSMPNQSSTSMISKVMTQLNSSTLRWRDTSQWLSHRSPPMIQYSMIRATGLDANTRVPSDKLQESQTLKRNKWKPICKWSSWSKKLRTSFPRLTWLCPALS